MKKNQKGMTFISLVITIIFLMILSTVSITSGYLFIKNFRIGKIISNMMLVKAKSETIYEDYKISNNSTILGEGPVDLEIDVSQDEKNILQQKGISNFDTLEWYKWNRTKLMEEGLDGNMVSATDCFYINYENGEILFSKGSIHNDKSYYSLTALKEIYAEE